MKSTLDRIATSLEALVQLLQQPSALPQIPATILPRRTLESGFDEARLHQAIRSFYIDGTVTYADMAIRLNNEGFKTVRGKAFHAASVRVIMMSLGLESGYCHAGRRKAVLLKSSETTEKPAPARPTLKLPPRKPRGALPPLDLDVIRQQVEERLRVGGVTVLPPATTSEGINVQAIAGK